MRPRPGTGSAPLRQASFPAEQKLASPGMLGMEAPWRAYSLRASPIHREPALSWSAHPDTPSKDGWCGLAGPFYSAHFPSALLSTSFPSALLSTSAPSPVPRPAQTISPGRKETGVQVSFSLLLLPNTALPLLFPALRTEPVTLSPISPMGWTSPSHTQ